METRKETLMFDRLKQHWTGVCRKHSGFLWELDLGTLGIWDQKLMHMFFLHSLNCYLLTVLFKL